MKKLLLFLCLAATLSSSLGQVRRDSASRIRFGSALPATCNPGVGQVFFVVSPGSPVGLHQCLATDTWTFSAGSITGTGADNQVAVFTGSNDIDSSASLTFDGSDLGVTANIDILTDTGILSWGAAQDAQMHRGDGADIIEQRRGTNPQEWRLYDRFVSHSDYDRLGIYIGGGPPLKTIEIEAESTVAGQGISIDIEARPGGSSDGRLNLKNGSGSTLTIEPSSASLTTTGSGLAITSAGTQSLTLNGFLSSIGVSTGTPGNAIVIDLAGQGAADFDDSHNIQQIGRGENANVSVWKYFVDVTDISANSLFTWQDSQNAGGFVTDMTLSDDGDWNLPIATAFHAIGASGEDTGHQLRIDGDWFATNPGSTILTSTKFQVENRLTGAQANTTGLFGVEFDVNIRTQTITESIADVAQLNLEEPDILDNLTGGGVITQASTLRVNGAPTEGVANFAVLVESGLSSFGGTVESPNADGYNLLNEASSRTNPTLVANKQDLGTGIGGTSSQEISLIVDSIEAVRVDGGQVVRIFGDGGNGQSLNIKQNDTTVSTASGSSVTAVGLIPAGSFVIGVTTRVTTAVTGPTGYDVGDGNDVDRWGNSIAVALNTTSDLTDVTNSALELWPTASDVVITSDGVDFTGGVIRVVVEYIDLNPPTS